MQSGYQVFDVDPRVLKWAEAAHKVALKVTSDPEARHENLRHGDTWFVGVDALPNDETGAVGDVPLAGPWEANVDMPDHWHPAQISVVYPGYPKQDKDESDANHRFRIARAAAHVDGLLPIGSARRRFLQEPHMFILGLPLNNSRAAPLVVWPGSHRVMGEALSAAIGSAVPEKVDLTEIYQLVRKQVFEMIEPKPVYARPGQSVLLHRHVLHGVAPWQPGDIAPPEGRMIAYFRPQGSMKNWLQESISSWD